MSDLVLKVAAKAVIVKDGKLLVLREADSYEDGTNIGRYHFPGGRLEPGESYKDGLMREVKEETGLNTKVGQPFFVGEWNPVIKGIKHHIIAVFSLCYATTEDVKLSKEHDDFKWIDPKNYTIDLMNPENDVISAYLKMGHSA